MEKRPKSQVIGEYKSRIILIDEFISVLETLKNSDLVKQYNGKKLTKRFIDKVKPILPEHIKLYLTAENWSQYLNIEIWFEYYVVNLGYDIRKYLNYNDLKCIIYQEKDSTYCLNGIREFNYEKFIECTERKIKLLQNEKEQYEKSIEMMDYVIQKTNELKKLVDDTLNTFPPYIKPYITFNYTIYED